MAERSNSMIDSHGVAAKTTFFPSRDQAASLIVHAAGTFGNSAAVLCLRNLIEKVAAVFIALGGHHSKNLILWSAPGHRAIKVGKLRGRLS